VAHSADCRKRIIDAFKCDCPKRFYCEGCDAQHYGIKCPRTVLDAIVEAVEFKEKSLKRLLTEILDSAEARSTMFYTMDAHIKSRIAELVERHGNLGMTRRKLVGLAKKELARRNRRALR
jgi:hypothetical protein